MNPIIKNPSAWVPIAMSLAVLTAMLIYIGVAGAPTRQPDEGTGAHLFQIWLVLELLLIAFFALKWLPRKPKQTFLILAIQILATLGACAPVFYFHL